VLGCQKGFGCCCRAFFPLTGGLSSYPIPTYSGSSINAGPVADPLFGAAFKCNRQQSAQIMLEPVPYATNGEFTVNLWFQVALSTANCI
jgi:hypothetical protein